MYQTLTTDSQRQKTKNTCGKILGNIGLFLLVFLAAVPVLWLIYLSLKSNTDILTNPLALPDTLHWENYVNAYKTIPFYSMVKNTGIVILISVPVSMLLSIFAAFALGRMRFGSGKVQNKYKKLAMKAEGNYKSFSLSWSIFLLRLRRHHADVRDDPADLSGHGQGRAV